MRHDRAFSFRWPLLALAIAAVLALSGCDTVFKLLGIGGGGSGSASLTLSQQSVTLAPQEETLVIVTAKNADGDTEGFSCYALNGSIASANQVTSTLLRIVAGSTTGNTSIYISSDSGITKQLAVSVTAGGGGGTTTVTAPSLSCTYYDSSSVALSWNSVSGASSYELQRALQSDYSWASIYTGTSTYYNATALYSSTAYVFRVRVTTSAGTSNYSASFQITTSSSGSTGSVPAGSPTVYYNPAQYSIYLYWSGVYNATYYYLERYSYDPTSGSVGALQHSQYIYSTEYTDTSVSPSTSYMYKVTAANDYGQSSYAAYVYPTTQGVNTSATFYAPSVGYSKSYNYAYLSWDTVYDSTNTTAAPYYRVYKYDSTSYSYQIVSDHQTSTYYYDYPIAADTYFYYEVCALDSSMVEQQMTYVTVMTDSDPNAAPTKTVNVYASGVDSSSIYVYWDYLSSYVWYEVYRLSTYYDDATESNRIYSGYNTSLTDSGLTSSMGYYYKVRAVSTGGSGPFSSAAYAYTSAPTTPPNAPQAPYAESINGNKSINLAWNSVSGATSYTLYYSVNNGSVYGAGSFTTPSAQFSNSGNGLTAGAVYTFYVTANNGAGASANSETFSYTAPSMAIISFN